jgi:hypothetical protein
MGIGKIIKDFSWETLLSLPPTELLSLMLIVLVPLALLWYLFLLVLYLSD